MVELECIVLDTETCHSQYPTPNLPKVTEQGTTGLSGKSLLTKWINSYILQK